MEQLRKLYADYLEQARAVRKKAPAWAGVFGLGDDPRKHPCHENFYENAQGWLREFVAAQPSREQARLAAEFILEEPQKHKNTDGYWFLYVCVGFIRDLIPYLGKDDCAALALRMNSLYPRRDRMPVQQDTFKALQKAGK